MRHIVDAVTQRTTHIASVCTIAAVIFTIGTGFVCQNEASAQMPDQNMRHGQGHGQDYGMGRHRGGGGGHMMHHHGADGTGHDMMRMPGLRGLDASEEESQELAIMFRNFQDIERTVTKLPNGIRTTTYSADEDLMGVVISHVSGMINRVEEGRDPQIFIQSPTLDILFERGDQIETEIETTSEGIIVTQISDDPEIVSALHTHADEVTEMADRGMAAVHDMMMKRAGN